MNIKDFVGPALLAVGITILFRSFWPGFSGASPDTGFVAPLSKTESEPLLLEVDFQDDEKAAVGDPVTIATQYGSFTFSSQGATVSELIFSRGLDGQKQQFRTIGKEAQIERETRAFLVALDNKTPFNYSLKDVTEGAETAAITYVASNDDGKLEKTFIVDKKLHKLELALTVSPSKGKEMRPRIIWPSAYLMEMEDDQGVNALSLDKVGSFVTKAQTKLNERAGFFSPQLFGSENKYFIHSMVQDANVFTTRAYYKTVDKRLLSFLEGPKVDKETTWTLSFYVGPRSLEAIAPVAPSLEKALNYGFFSPITKVMLYLLKQLHKYVYNYGWAIVLLTLLLKLLLLPFAFKGQQKMKKMQEYQKKLAYLQQKYKGDPQGLKAAQEELIRKHGLPGMGGCLPILLQMPVFFGISGALNNSIELYRAPFIWWIKDLSLPDPYYVLPVLTAFAVLLGTLAAQEKTTGIKQNAMAIGLALFLGAWTASMAAGLALFIGLNAFLHFVQTFSQKALDL